MKYCHLWLRGWIWRVLFFVRALKTKKMENFSFTFSYFFSDALPVFMKMQVSDLCHFPSVWKTLHISCKAGLLVTNTPNFCLSEKVFIPPSLLKDNFTGYGILGWWNFSLNSKYFTQLPYCLHGFWEDGCNSYLYLPMGKGFFPLVTFKIFFLSLI